jgi:DNA-binding beta-propeller fold protein YncE
VKWVVLLTALLALAAPANGARRGGARAVALVTAETENQLIAVDLPSGHVVKRLHLPADPENVDGRPLGRIAVVVSTRGRAVSLVDTQTLRVVRILHRFTKPHIAAITPGGRYAYVTDDRSGKLSVIDLRHRRIVRRVFVGLGAHHLAISPDGGETWVALGERAHSIAVLDTSSPARPRVLFHFTPHETAHDLAFIPSGARVWITSDTSSRVGVYSAGNHRLLKTFAGGAPPQHVAFRGNRAYVTAGYAGTMQIREARRARLLRTIYTDYGSFNLGLGPDVLSSSLLRGTLTALRLDGRRVGQWHLAPATRDVALVLSY